MTKKFFSKESFISMKNTVFKILKLIVTSITIVFFMILTLIVFSSDIKENNSKKKKEIESTLDFNKEFVNYKKYSNKAAIKLHLKTGCLWYENDKAFSPMPKSTAEFDCSQEYVDEYNAKNKESKEDKK